METNNNYILSAVDIFAGAGGLSLGAEMAGIEVKLAIELSTHAATTYQVNHKQTKVLCSDIRDINPLEYTAKHPFIVFGGPPCQGFSIANTKTRNLDNQNNWMFKEYLRFIAELQPEWFLFENVEGFKTFNSGDFAKEVEKELGQLGYKTSSAVLNASDFGVPQKRSRFFIVGHSRKKGGIKFDFNKLKRKKQISIKDALADLPSLSNGWKIENTPYKSTPNSTFAKMMRKGSKAATQNYVTENKPHIVERYKVVKQGENWESIKLNGMLDTYKTTRNTHSGIYKRLHEDEPSVTIANYRKSMLIHPWEDRGLSVREAARLQSFPDTFIFKGSLGSIQQQVGNAVPPLLAMEIFKTILEHKS